MEKETYLEAAVKQFIKNKLDIKRMEFENKEMLAEIVEMTGAEERVIGSHKLTKVRRKGSVRYSEMVSDIIPNVSKTPYTGPETTYWSIK